MEEASGIEDDKRTKVIVTTALGKTKYVLSAFKMGKEVYVGKPVEIEKTEEAMKNLGLI